MKLEKAFLVGIAVLSTVIVALLGWILWTLLMPLDHLFEAPAVWPVREHVIRPGDDVIVDLKFCKRTDLAAEIGRMTTGKDEAGNEFVYNNPNITGSMPTGCYFKHLSVATIPQNAPPGEYQVTITVRFQYSSFRTYQQNFETEKFDVVPKASANPF